jgi:hypothetical protein
MCEERAWWKHGRPSGSWVTWLLPIGAVNVASGLGQRFCQARIRGI